MAELSISEQAEVNRLGALPERDLFILIGQEAYFLQTGQAVILADETAYAAGKEWIKHSERTVYNSICIDKDYCRFPKDSKNTDRLSLLFALADLKLGGAATLAYFTSKVAFDAFCQCHLPPEKRKPRGS